MKRITLLLLFPLLVSVSSAQDYLSNIQLDNKTYDEDFESICLIADGERLSPPVGILGETKFSIDFDDLSLEPRYLKYTFIHCTHDWQLSDMNQIEYINGFLEDDITDYEHSFNTIEPYMHYHAVFPNENMSFSKSGNYILFIYDDTPENPIMTRRFMVVEPNTVGISTNVHSANDVNYKYTKQEVDFIVYPGAYMVRNPQLTLHATIQQNGRWDNAKIGVTYKAGSAAELFFDHRDGRNCFDGGAEFRTFDLTTIRSNSDRIVGISFVNKHNHAYVLQDDARPYSAYESRGTMQGRRIFYNRDMNNVNSEDYVFTHFTLKSDYPFEGGDVYVFGELTDWQIKKDAKLRYNKEFDFWETDFLLKQGAYNYQYVFVPKNSNTIDATYIEGSHYETSNIYSIYIYFREEGTYYDKLIGYKTCSITD